MILINLGNREKIIGIKSSSCRTSGMLAQQCPYANSSVTLHCCTHKFCLDSPYSYAMN